MMEDQPPLTSPDGSSNRNTPERGPHPLDSQDSTQEDEADSLIVVKVENLEESEESYVSSDDHCKEEEIPPVVRSDPRDTRVKVGKVRKKKIKDDKKHPEIGIDGRYRQNSTEKCSKISSDDDLTCELSEEKPITRDLHLTLLHDRLSPENSVEVVSVHDLSNPTAHQMARTRPKKFPCVQCGKCFSQRTKLLIHERIHTGEKPFSCSECGKCFAEKGSLVQHQKFHAGEKPYPCTVCGKSFTLKGDVIKHERIHTGEKPYSCSVCGKCFTLKGDLVKHARSHTGEKPYSCHMCGKAFTLKSVLVAHQRTHTDEKPYACSVCGKSFAQKTNLSTHERTHTGERPYSCSECGRAFTRRGNLISHQQSHQ